MSATLRPIANPPNPYSGETLEWLGPPPHTRLEVYEEHASSLLSENDSPDIPFRWSVNPYRGCQHACAYCYARPTHEYLGFGAGTDFDTRITVKLNAAELLDQELARSSWKREKIAFSGVTDCYQPLEAVYRLTQRCLEVCLARQTPVGIVTKSFLVVRDCDLLRRLHAAAGAHVLISIPFFDDDTARRIELGAPPPARRFEALRRLRDAGVPTGVLIAPLIPGLNDRDISRILERAAACGAQTASYTALRLPGNVANVFLERLRAALPLRAARIEALIRQMRCGRMNESRFSRRMRGVGNYWQGIRTLFEVSARKHGLYEHDLCGKPAGSTSVDAPRAAVQLPLFT